MIVKSFSAASFPSDQSEYLDKALSAVQNDPQALFTNFQWFLYRARNTVYFTAFCEQAFDEESLNELVTRMVALAPQLTHGFIGARPGQPFPKKILDAITSIDEVDNFDFYPDKWLDAGQDLFLTDELPLFRVKAIVRRGGPDELGRSSMILVRSSHALMEGSDSALLTRSQASGHGTMSSPKNKAPLSKRLGLGALAALTLPLHMISAHLLSPGKVEMGFRTLVFDRSRLRDISRRLGVRQRSLMFGVVMFALNKKGQGFSKKKIRSIYTMLDTERHDFDDDFFRVRSLDAIFPVINDLEQFVKTVDEIVGELEAKDITRMQFILNTMFKAHRALSGIFPFLYSKRFFRYNGNYDIVLTMVPPHRTYGELTEGMMEPIYCGSYHPGANLCTFVPARDSVTLNFSMRTKFLPQVDDIAPLISAMERED